MMYSQVISHTLLPTPSGELRIPLLLPEMRLAEVQSVALSLIVPTFNEAANVPEVVRRLTELLDQALPGDYELIIVDDNSPDRTWEVALELTPQYPQLRVMRRQDEKGLSTAVIRGWQASQGLILGVIDGDLQHPPEVLMQLFAKMTQGADLAVASRHVEGGGTSNWSFVRRFLSRGAQILGLVVLPQVVGRVSDPMSGYFMVRRSAIAERYLDPLGYKILLEVIGRGVVREVGEVGYVFQERLEGESKVTWKQYVDYLMHLLKLRSRGRIAKIRQRFQLGRFLRFGAVGLSGVVVDMLFLFLLSDPTMLALPLTRSKILASELAIANNFLWNDLWTFGDVAREQRGLRPRLKRFLKFNVICLMGLILNVLILNVLFNAFFYQFTWGRYAANLIAIAIVTVWNFWINLKLSWRVTDVK